MDIMHEYTKVVWDGPIQSARDVTSVVYQALREGKTTVVLTENVAANIMLLPPEDQSAAVDEELARGAAAWARDTEANRAQHEAENERMERENSD